MKSAKTVAFEHILAVLNTLNQGICLCDKKGNVLFANPAMSKLLGRPIHDLREIFPSDPSLYTVGENEKPLPIEQYPAIVAIRRKSGVTNFIMGIFNPLLQQRRWFSIDACPIYSAGDEEPSAAYTVAIDITEQRSADRDLRQSKLHLALAQSITSIGSAAVDFRTGKWDWSDQTFRIYGVDPNTFVPSAEALGALVHPEDWPGLYANVPRARQGGEPDPVAEYRIRRPDGAERILRRIATAVRDEAGRITGIVATVQDVTELRTAEREKDLLQAQLRQAQRLEAVGQITGGVAHDFNNLLTVILGNAEVIEKHLAENAPLRELAELTRMAAERGAELTRQLLAFSRQQPLDPKPVDVDHLVVGMTKLLQRVLGERIDINTICGTASWKALIDASQLENALLNLCVNARDAMANGGRLTIETKNVVLEKDLFVDDRGLNAANSKAATGQYVLISVSDTGTGMDEATRSKAFDPFFTTKDVGKGSGLGLSMVYGFVKQSNGHIRILSQLGLGTTIEFYLPRADEIEVMPRSEGGEAPIRGGVEKILIVEDDELVRRQTALRLRDWGYDVTGAKDGVEAMDILRTSDHFDILFTDVVMPRGINGWELAEQAAKLRPNLPILFASGYADGAARPINCLDSDNLLHKPYRPHELATKIRAILDRATGQRGAG